MQNLLIVKLLDFINTKISHITFWIGCFDFRMAFDDMNSRNRFIFISFISKNTLLRHISMNCSNMSCPSFSSFKLFFSCCSI